MNEQTVAYFVVMLVLVGMGALLRPSDLPSLTVRRVIILPLLAAGVGH